MRATNEDVAARLEATARIWQALEGREHLHAFATYLECYALCARRSAIEWRLSAAIVTAHDALDAGWLRAVPVDALRRPSGAALCFVVAQHAAGAQLADLGALADLPDVPAPAKRILALAWRRRPAARCLADGSLREAFAWWLAADAEAIGAVVGASAAVGDLGLGRAIAERWLSSAIAPRLAPALANDLATVPGLGDVVARIVRMALGLVYADDDGLRALLAAAGAVEDVDTALTISTILLKRNLPADTRRSVLIARLRALADGARHVAVAAEYRDAWMPLGQAYPEPAHLLESLQHECAEDEERHLVETAAATDAGSPRLGLTRAALRRRKTTDDDMVAWQQLYSEHPDDEAMLVAVSSATLRCADSVRDEWTRRLGLHERWRALSSNPKYRDPAFAAAWTALLCTDEDLLSMYVKICPGAPLGSAMQRRAARAWVRALAERGRWPELREIASTRPELFAIFGFAEREFIGLMSLQDALPSHDQDAAWCERWERLLSLPLEDWHVAQIAEHCARCLDELRKQRGSSLSSVMHDVVLQVQRRAAAHAEALLDPKVLPHTKITEHRKQLRDADLPSTGRLLRDLCLNAIGNAGRRRR